MDSRALDEFQRLHPDQTYQGDGARVARSAGDARVAGDARDEENGDD